MSKRFFLIDGLSQIFRCYYAPFRALSSPAGEPTRATYVFTEMLLKLIREQNPDYLAMAMDSPEPGFREELDVNYKAHREPPPEDLAPQIKRILEIVQSQDIPILAVPGFEADDILATIACRLADEDTELFLVSKDKDLDQILSERVKLFDPAKSEIIGPDELEKLKGYRPEKAVEVQTLCGDTIDNIPGVKGVGPKKAAALIAKYGTAANVIAHADELTPAMKTNVKAFADKVADTRRLVTLRQDVPLEFDLEQCRWTGLKGRRLQPVFAELGFRRLADQFAEAAPDTPAVQAECDAPLLAGLAAPPEQAPAGGALAQAQPKPVARTTKCDYVLVDSEARFRDFLTELRKQSCFAFDTETDSLNPVAARLAGLSFSWMPNTGYYVPICGIGDCLPLSVVLEGIRPVMTDPNVRKIGQNVKYDLVVLRCHGLEVRGVEFDSMIASFVLDSSRPSHGMNALARELLGFEPIPISDLIGKGAAEITFDNVETQRQCEYSAEDADVTWQLAEILREQLAGSELEALFAETEMPLVEVLAAMEYEGVRLNTEILARQAEEIGRKLEELRRQIHREVGFEFNIDSPRQLAQVLFDDLQLPVIRKTKTGRSTDAGTLDTLAFETGHAVPALVKEYRELIKLKGTYMDTLPQMICQRTGRIHAGFNQTTAITGRLSSSDPNLQNIPIRTEIGRRIRKAFVPRDDDHVLLTGDYSQIELRVLAHFCKDEALRAAFAEDRDIHQFVASQVFGVPLEEVTREQRGRAKAVNFGIIYGQTPFGLSRGTGMSVSEAEEFIRRYFRSYPGIRRFIDQIIAEAKRNGFVQTILGRRRAVPEINSRNRNLRTQAERLAVNTVIQGSAADLIKRAMIAIHRRIVNEQRPSRMIIQVHDELVFDVPRAAVEKEADFIRQEMTTALPLDVPIKVDLGWGDNWLDSK